MGLKCLRNCLNVFVPSLPALILIFIPAFFCFGHRIQDRKNPSGNADGGVLISQPAIPAQLTKEAEAKAQAFLKFFKTPTKQFMPLGFYAMADAMRDSEKLKELRRRGVILFHKYNSEQSIEDALGDLQSAQEAGVAVLQNLPDKYLNTRGREFWQQHITALANNKQILVWYLSEEVKPENLDKLEQIGNIIRATDAKHRPLITYVCDSEAEYLKRVSGIVDAVIFGAYPSYYMPRPRADIKRRIEKAYESGVPVVIAALEALKGRRNWTRPKDVRFDAYLALISGAKGIMWYAYYYAKPRPELLEAVLKVATELNGPENLGEVLLSGKEPKSLECRLLEGPTLSPPASAYEEGWEKKNEFKQYNSVQWTAREYENYLYIFAVNTAQRVETGIATDDGGSAYTVKVKFGPISSSFSKIQIISENRITDLSNGYFVDTFEPLGTHIYKIKLN
jgi:hypothetical protein